MRQILAQAEACLKPGALGALLRREALYFRISPSGALRSGAVSCRGPARRRGPAIAAPDLAQQQIATLEQTLATATARGERAELIIEAQEGFSQLIGLTLPPHDGSTELR